MAAETTTTTSAPQPPSTLQALADRAHPGGAAAIFVGVHGPGVESYAAAGADGDGKAVDPEMRWEGASIAKMVVATAVLHLVDRGLIDLDSPVAEYVDFPVPDQITVRDVLRHGSGIRNLSDQLDECPTPDTLEAMEAAAASASGPTEPGEYSNTNYLLLGHLVRRVGGRDIDAYAQEHLFDPLGIEDTYWWETRDTADFYLPAPSDVPVSPVTCDRLDVTVGTEGLTFVTTAQDMNSFLIGLFSGRLLAPETLAEMLPPEGSEVGLGMWSETNGAATLYGHFGSRGFETVSYYDPVGDLAITAYGTEGVDVGALLWTAWDWATQQGASVDE